MNTSFRGRNGLEGPMGSRSLMVKMRGNTFRVFNLTCAEGL